MYLSLPPWSWRSRSRRADRAPAARDKLDLRVAKQNVNLCTATLADEATARHRGRAGAGEDRRPRSAPTRRARPPAVSLAAGAGDRARPDGGPDALHRAV